MGESGQAGLDTWRRHPTYRGLTRGEVAMLKPRISPQEHRPITGPKGLREGRGGKVGQGPRL